MTANDWVVSSQRITEMQLTDSNWVFFWCPSVFSSIPRHTNLWQRKHVTKVGRFDFTCVKNLDTYIRPSELHRGKQIGYVRDKSAQTVTSQLR